MHTGRYARLAELPVLPLHGLQCVVCFCISQGQDRINAGWSSHQERSAQAACRYGHPQAWHQSGPGLRSLRAVEKKVLRTTFRDCVRRSGKPCMRNRSPYLLDKCAGLPETDPRGPRLQCTAELSVPEQLSTRICRHKSMLDHGAAQRRIRIRFVLLML